MENELELLKDECLKKDGTPRRNCDLEKLRRLVELQAAKPIGPQIEAAPDEEKKLRAEYDNLVKKLFINEDGETKLKPKSRARDLARWQALRDMLRQPKPKPERIEAEVLPDDRVEIKVKPGPPVNLEGRDKLGWHIIARIMPQGGVVKVPKDKFQAFRITRGSDKPQYIELNLSTSNPNRKVSKKKKPKYEIEI